MKCPHFIRTQNRLFRVPEVHIMEVEDGGVTIGPPSVVRVKSTIESLKKLVGKWTNAPVHVLEEEVLLAIATHSHLPSWAIAIVLISEPVKGENYCGSVGAILLFRDEAPVTWNDAYMSLEELPWDTFAKNFNY